MTDYINRNAVVMSILCAGKIGKQTCIDIIKQESAADVRPVVRGKWEVGGMFDDIGRCSNCHYMFPVDTAITEFKYCPNCGADMRQEVQE